MHPLNLSLCAPPDEQRLRAEIEAEQIVHVDLAEYQPGCARYEALIAAMSQQPMENV